MKKEFKILIALAAIYIIVSIVFYFIENTSKIVYIGDHTKVIVNGDELSVDNENIKIPSKNVKYYFNKSISNGYLYADELDYNNYYYLTVLSEDGKPLKFNDSVLAMTNNLDIKVEELPNNVVTNEDVDVIREYMSSQSIEKNISYVFKSSFDLDNDGNYEDIYSVSLNEDYEKYTTLILIKSGDFIEKIDESSYEEDSSEYRKISLFKLIDFNLDNNYEIVIKEKNGDDKPTYFNIYSYNNKNITKVE